MNSISIMEDRKEVLTPQIVPKVLFICGILSSLLYIGADIIAAMQWESYSYTSQAVSELGALGAPTRPLLLVLFGIYDVLVFAFGLGLLATESTKCAQRITGILLIIYAIVGQVTFMFFPMHLRGVSTLETDQMHLLLTYLNVIVMLMSVGMGAAVHGKRFRLYSIVTIMLLILFGAWVGLDVPQIAAGLPTPWHGIKERVCIYGYMLWVMVLAVTHLRAT